MAVTYQVHELEQAIAAQEAVRPAIGDAVVEIVLGALRAQLDALHPPRLPGRAASAAPRIAPPQSPQRRASDRVEPARPPAAAASERKHVTVLFADLADFTALSERHDAALIRELQTDLFDHLSDAVRRYGGFVEKFVGDAIMAVFGAPVPHADHAERAVRAALAMRAAIARLNARWAARLGADLALHVGVNSGAVVAGYLGSAPAGAYAVTGDAVNTAARLQQAARPGQTLVGADTYRLVPNAFVFRPLGPTPIRGKREPLAVLELLAARPLPDPRTAARSN